MSSPYITVTMAWYLGSWRILVVVLGLTGLANSGGWLGKLPPLHTPDPKWDPEPSQSVLGEFNYAAVSVDSIPCAKIGK